MIYVEGKQESYVVTEKVIAFWKDKLFIFTDRRSLNF